MGCEQVSFSISSGGAGDCFGEYSLIMCLVSVCHAKFFKCFKLVANERIPCTNLLGYQAMSGCQVREV